MISPGLTASCFRSVLRSGQSYKMVLRTKKENGSNSDAGVGSTTKDGETK